MYLNPQLITFKLVLSNNGIFLKSIERAKIDAKGRITHWERLPEQAKIDRYIHSSAIIGNTLFLIGGHVDNQPKLSYGDIEYAKIDAHGQLNPWTVAPLTLSQGRFLAQATSIGNTLFLMGGHDGSQRLNSVEYSHFNHRDEFTPWRPSREQRALGSGDGGPEVDLASPELQPLNWPKI